NCGVTNVSDLTPLKDMKLTFLGIGETKVKNLSPLKGMKLDTLWCNDSLVEDLSPLKEMKEMRVLWCNNTRVKDLSPLEGMPLIDVGFDVRPGMDLKPIRSIRTLETINGKKPADFWRGVGK